MAVSELSPRRWEYSAPVCLSVGTRRSWSGEYANQESAQCLRVDSSRPDCLKVNLVLTKPVEVGAENRQ